MRRTLKNNIVHTSTPRESIGSFVRASTNNPTTGEAYNNIIYNSSKDFVIVHGGMSKWPANSGWEDFKKATSDPLSVHDIATAKFSVAEGFESYGPER